MKTATPYTVIRDGKVIDCTPIHPYLMDVRSDSLRELHKLFDSKKYGKDFIVWFFDNVPSLNEYIQQLVASYYHIFNEDIDEYLFNKIFNNSISKYKLTKRVEDIDNLLDLYTKLNYLTNQYVLRFRTSDIRFGGSNHSIYFRISSDGFNWFNYIWEIVYNNKNWLSDITIVKDPQALGVPIDTFYNLNGIVTNHMPINDFIILKGNPIIEKFEDD